MFMEKTENWAGSFKKRKNYKSFWSNKEVIRCSRNENTEIFYSTIGDTLRNNWFDFRVELFIIKKILLIIFLTKVKKGTGLNNLLKYMTNDK